VTPQLDNQLSNCVYPCPVYTEAKQDSAESPVGGILVHVSTHLVNRHNITVTSTEDPWFLDASVLLRRDKFGNVTRLE